ncbi:MAG: transcriptional repressor [Candidatus Staskawiczbacteria bacterium]|jgi:Fur family ferric uptake transcriptional regulator
MINIKEILLRLKKEGFRSTTIRKSILDLFYKFKKPLSSQDIQKYLKQKNIKANKTTVYRELDFLKNQNIIEEFQLDDKIKRYEILSSHHHHTVCIKCREIKCIEFSKDLESQEKEIEKNNKFKIINHSLEFYGLCHACWRAGHKCQAVK